MATRFIGKNIKNKVVRPMKNSVKYQEQVTPIIKDEVVEVNTEEVVLEEVKVEPVIEEVVVSEEEIATPETVETKKDNKKKK